MAAERNNLALTVPEPGGIASQVPGLAVPGRV